MSDILQQIFGGSKSDTASQQTSSSQQQQGAVQNAAQQSTQTGFNTGQSTQTGNSSSTTSNYTDPALSGLSGSLADTLKQVLSSFSQQTANAGNPIANSTAAPQAGVTPQEQQLLGNITQQTGPNTDSANYIKQVLGGAFMPGSANQNPFLGAAITAAQRPTLDNLTQTLTRALPGRFTANGQLIQPNTGDQGGSSAFDRASALAFQSAANASTDIASNIGNNAYNTGISQMNTAAGLDQNQVNQTISGLQAAALPRLIQQNGLDKGLALFQQQTSNLLDFLKTIGTVQAPTLGSNAVSSSSGQSTTAGGTAGQSTGTSSGASFGSGTSNSQGTSIGSSTSSKGIIPDIFKPV